MSDTTVTKIDSEYSPHGTLGQKYLASGKKASMRLWEDGETPEVKPFSTRKYETVGYMIKGRAELRFENGQVVLLEAAIRALCPKAKRTPTKSSNRSPLSKRLLRPLKFT